MSFTKIDHYEKEYVDHHHDSALSVTEGVADQPIVNPYFVRKKKHRLSTEEYVKGILEGNITTLSQAITLIESSNPDHYAQAQEIIERCLPHCFLDKWRAKNDGAERQKKADRKEEKKNVILGGICCGLALCVASNLQQIGIQYTTVGKAGFITEIGRAHV